MICKLLRFFFIIIIIFFIKEYSFAQVKDPAAITDSAVADSSETHGMADSAGFLSNDNTSDTIITQAIFKNDEDSILKWRKGREFNYMVYLDSMLKKRKDLRQDTMDVVSGSLTKNKSGISSSNSNSSSGIFLNSPAVKVFFWALAIFFILFIVYKLFFKSDFFARQKKIREDAVPEEPEKLNEFSEFYSLVNDAEKNNDYNLAIRYLYLQCLRRLAEKEVIVFMQDKTNYDYVRELAGREFQPQFTQLTNNYERAWYGKFVIEKNVYQAIKERFIAFNKTI